MLRPYQYQFPFARYPAIRILVLVVLGILVAYKVTDNHFLWFVVLLSTIFLFFWFNIKSDQSHNLSFHYLGQASYLISIFIFGAFWYSHAISRAEPFYKEVLDTYIWEEVVFQGELQQKRRTGTGTYQLDLDIHEFKLSDSLKLTGNFTIRALLPPEKSISANNLNLGDVIHFRATLYPLDEKRNPRQFDYKKYLATLGIHHQAGIDSIYSIMHAANSLSWNRLRQNTIDLINRIFSANTAPLAKALLIGYKQELEYNDKIAFSRVGLSHIMAVSGLHVGFLLAPFWLLIPYFWTWKFGRSIGLLLLIILLFSYAGITGFSASVTRASLTGGFIIYAKLFNKVRDTINLTAVAAILILLQNPAELFEVGFQLSFGAVFIILLTIPPVNNALPSQIRYRWYGKLLMIFVVSFFVQLGLYPILSYYFGEYSIVGPLVNVFVVPILGIVLPYALFILPLAAFFPEVVKFLNLPVEYFLEALQSLVSIIGSWEGSWIQTTRPGVILFLIWPVTIFLIASSQIPKLRWKIFCLLLVLGVFHQGTGVLHIFKPLPLGITVFDVGQGDAVLVRTPGGKNFLIDTGRWTPGYNSGKYILLPHLKAEGISKLDAIFLSHPHADHIGGILDLIQSVPIDTIYNSGFPYSSNLYKNYLLLADEKGIPVVSLSAGNEVRLDKAIRIFCYGPAEIKGSSDPNEHSLILELHYGSTEFLFMGDAGSEQEAKLLRNYGKLLDTDFLKVGHHGSKTSSSTNFLNMVKPEYAVISLARSNKFRHPHREAVQRLQASQSRLHYTSLEGALLFTSDGETIRKVSWR